VQPLILQQLFYLIQKNPYLVNLYSEPITLIF